MHQRLILALFGLLFITYAQAHEQKEPVSVYLKWAHQYQFAGIYAALEKGFYHQAGFDVTLINRHTQLQPADAVLTNRATFSITDASVILRRLNKEPLVVVSTIFQHSPLVFLTLESSNITSPHNFIGKRVMYSQDDHDASLLAMFTTLSINTEDFITQPYVYDVDALSSGATDVMAAYLTLQPFYYQQKNIAIRVIDPASYGIDFYGDLLIAHEDYVRANPARAKAFAEATIQGWAYALHHPEEVIDWLLNKYDSPSSHAQLTYEAKTTAAMINATHIPLGTINEQRFRRIADTYKMLGLAARSSHLEGLTLDAYLDPQKQFRQTLIRISGIIAIVAGSLCLFLWAVNVRLRKKVAVRTRALVDANQVLAQQLNLIDRNVYTTRTNRHGDIEEASSAFCTAMGYQLHELIGRNEREFRHPDFTLKDPKLMVNAFLSGRPWCGEFMLLTKAGSKLWVHSTITPHINERGEIDFLSSISTDITSHKLLEIQSRTDPLTGIANRLAIDEKIQSLWEYFRRYGDGFSILLFDLDHFKRINDKYGHIEGDRVLNTICFVVTAELREVDMLGRWGGEEFMVICPNTDKTSALSVAEKLRQAIAEATILPEQPLTASFGVSCANEANNDPSQLLRLADEALYRAKSQGRNRVCSAADSSQETQQEIEPR